MSTYAIENVMIGSFVDVGFGAYDLRLNEAHGGFVYLLLEGDDQLVLVKAHPGTEAEYDPQERVFSILPEHLSARSEA